MQPFMGKQFGTTVVWVWVWVVVLVAVVYVYVAAKAGGGIVVASTVVITVLSMEIW
jgi:hypothetical protein